MREGGQASKYSADPTGGYLKQQRSPRLLRGLLCFALVYKNGGFDFRLRRVAPTVAPTNDSFFIKGRGRAGPGPAESSGSVTCPRKCCGQPMKRPGRNYLDLRLPAIGDNKAGSDNIVFERSRYHHCAAGSVQRLTQGMEI